LVLANEASNPKTTPNEKPIEIQAQGTEHRWGST
jgi:hypothetical protein